MLALALKNRTSIVVASDTDSTESTTALSEFNIVPDNKVLIITGNVEVVKHPIEVALQKNDPSSSVAALAELVQASLIIETVPHLAEIKGRVEVMIAGFNKIHHDLEPDIYYLDSAQDFFLKSASDDALASGATAALTSLFAGHSFADSTTAQLGVLVKESYSATKLRWPSIVKAHVKLATITPTSVTVQTY
jgi:hypothetical protein